MLRQLSRAKRLILAFSLLLLTLCVVLATSYERLTTTLANQYLAEYDTQITELSIKPESFNVWHFPRLTLMVHGTRVAIVNLEINLNKGFSPFQLFTSQVSLSQIDKIALGQIDVVLNPAVLTDEGKNLDEQGPTLALDLNQLPEIDIGETSVSLAGIDPVQLNLVMDKLQLDDTGQLNTSLSHQGNRLYNLEANLSEQRWKISASLVFDELTTLLSRLSAQELNDSALTPLLNLKQQIEDANIKLSGSLNSTVDLNLKTAQLTSHHTLTDAQLILDNLESLTLEPHSSNINADVTEAVPEDAETAKVSTNKNLEFELNGHLADLSLNLLPFNLSLAPNPAQQEVLLNLIQDDTVKQQTKQLIQALSKASSPEIRLSLKQPLTYSLQDKTISWAQLQLSIAQSKLDATVSLNDALVSLPNQNREANREQLSLNGKWQFSAEHRQALSINEFLVEPLSIADKSIADIELGTSSLALEGAFAVAANNKVVSHETTSPFTIELTVNKDAKVNTHQLSVKKSQTSPSSQTDSEFSFNNQMAWLRLQDDLSLSYDETGQFEIALPKLTMHLGPISYRHLRPSSKSKTVEFDAETLTFNSSEPSHLRLDLATNSNHNNRVSDSNSGNSSDNAQPVAEFEFIAAPFTLESSSIRFADLKQNDTDTSSEYDSSENKSSDSLITTEHVLFNSQGRTRLASEIRQHEDPLKTSSKELQISLPRLSLEQTQTELSHTPFPTSSKDHYFLSLPHFGIQLEKPSLASVELTYLSESISAEPTLTAETSHESDFERFLKTSQLANNLNYEIDGLEINHTYIKNKRKRKQKLLHLYQATLTQSLKWDDYRLDTQEHWSIDGLEFESEHSLTPGAKAQAMLQGKLDLDTELSTLLFLVQNSYALPSNIYMDGQTQLKANYQLFEESNNTLFNVDFSPDLSSLNGSISDLPFEGVDMSAHCNFSLLQDSQGTNRRSFTCPEMGLTAAAFNPGVLITNLKADGDISLSLDDAPLEAPSDGGPIRHDTQLNNSVAANLSSAEIHLNATGDLLGGQVLLPEFSLKLHDRSHGYLVLQGLSLEELIAIQPQVGIYADGIFDGVLPVDLVDGRVSVTGGRLAARAPGGLISISGNPAVEQMRLSQPYLDFAFSTMEHLQYTELSSTFDMQPSGDALLKVNVKGRGKGIERPIHLNYSQEENMLQLLKSLQVGDKLQTQIEQSMN